MNENNGDSFNSIRFHRATFGSTISPENLSEYLRAGPEDQANSEGGGEICRRRIAYLPPTGIHSQR